MSRGLDLASKCMACLNNGKNVNNVPNHVLFHIRLYSFSNLKRF